MAAATFAATARFVDVVRGRDGAFFEGLRDEGIDGGGDALEGVLGAMESLDAGVVAAAGAEVFEAVDFGLVKLLAGAVELLELVAEGHHFAVEADGVFVSEEGLGLVAGGADGGIVGDGGAKFGDTEFDGLGKGAGHRGGG